MSHEIIAISYSTGKKISEITLEASDQGKSWLFYESLGCSGYNLGFTGNGKNTILTQNELNISLSKFYYLRGESKQEIIEHITASKPFQRYCKLLSKILKSVGINPKSPIITMDINKNNDIELFLVSLQNIGDIIIFFG
jgi:hypothetical protein